ncbi:hypothetical protein GCM10023163_04000 [Aestuariibaculum suncheonense]
MSGFSPKQFEVLIDNSSQINFKQMYINNISVVYSLQREIMLNFKHKKSPLKLTGFLLLRTN